MVSDRPQPHDLPLIRSIASRRDNPTTMGDGPLQARFDEALGEAVGDAQSRLQLQLSIPLSEPPDDVAHGIAADIGPSRTWYATLRATLDRAAITANSELVDASRSVYRTTAFLAAGAEARPLSLGPIHPHELFPRLGDGYMLVAEHPLIADTSLADLVADLTMAYGAEDPVLYYGIRSALGPPPIATEHPRLLIQLLGTRAVLFAGPQHRQQQTKMQPGVVALLPAGCTAAHLPLDEDTAHVEIALTRLAPDSVEADRPRSARAMLPVERATTDDEGSRRAMNLLSGSGSSLRLFAPGGVQVTDESRKDRSRSIDKVTTVVVGGQEVELSPDGVELLVALAGGRYTTPEDLATRCKLPDADVRTALDALSRAGVLALAPRRADLRPNPRLTQVAATNLGGQGLGDKLLAAIDPDLWRPPADGEVFFGDDLDVAVQELTLVESAAPAHGLQRLASTLNSRYFGAELRATHHDDPPLLVRVRPGRPSTAKAVSDVLGSDLSRHSTRKITWAFAVNDADGGWIHLPAGSEAPAPEVGTLIAWISARPWRLAPLPSGERLLVIGRLHGSPYR